METAYNVGYFGIPFVMWAAAAMLLYGSPAIARIGRSLLTASIVMSAVLFLLSIFY